MTGNNEDLRDSLMDQIRDAGISVAKSALANPFMYHQGVNLSSARDELIRAKAREAAAQKAWDALIAPACNWAPDPLKEVK